MKNCKRRKFSKKSTPPPRCRIWSSFISTDLMPRKSDVIYQLHKFVKRKPFPSFEVLIWKILRELFPNFQEIAFKNVNIITVVVKHEFTWLNLSFICGIINLKITILYSLKNKKLVKFFIEDTIRSHNIRVSHSDTSVKLQIKLSFWLLWMF